MTLCWYAEKNLFPYGLSRDPNFCPYVRFRCTLSKVTMSALEDWIIQSDKKPTNYLFTRRTGGSSKTITARQLHRLVKDWATGIGLDPSSYGIESLRRTRSL